MKTTLEINLLKKGIPTLFLLALILTPFCGKAQAEFTTWGNMTGIRVDNQLLEFNTSLAIENKDGNTRRTRKEGQDIDFKREGARKIFNYQMRDLEWNKSIETKNNGSAEVKISFSSPVDTIINGAYFSIQLPKEFDDDSQISFSSPETISLKELSSSSSKAQYNAPTKGISIKSKKRSLEVVFNKSTQVIIHEDDSQLRRIDILIAGGEISAGEKFENVFRINAAGDIDKSQVSVKIFPEQEGKEWEGLGGNFRLQNAKTDPQVIDYSLENLNVEWSRIEMPWREWHPNRDEDPAAEARKGNLHPKVKAAMEMGQRLDKMGIPVMLAGWFAPEWAIIGEPFKGKHPDGTMGNLLDLSRIDDIYASIVSYVKYMKEEYDVEVVLFSFNESDLGIDVRQTAEEHNDLIKELGQLFRAEGIQTKFLLGDTADANGWEFTNIASMDPESRPYIGGVSFHSWRGYTDENLIKWRDISNRVDAPLYVGEGSIDAGAWRYPQIFEEPTYALDEIDVYIKMMNVAQPASILQWQLTADYSVLSGGGIFGNEKDKLYPTQRFYNLQQLSNTPLGLKFIPVKNNKKDLTIAALGSRESGAYALHIVNKGATRNMEITGIPAEVATMDLYVTDKEKSFKKLETLEIHNGKASFSLKGASFISLVTPQ